MTIVSEANNTCAKEMENNLRFNRGRKNIERSFFLRKPAASVSP